jgi:hypothetical protein
MDWKDYVIIGGALFVLFGGGVYAHYRKKGEGQIQAEPTGPVYIDDLRRLGAAVSTVGGKAFAEGGKLMKSGALKYVARSERKQMHMVGAV